MAKRKKHKKRLQPEVEAEASPEEMVEEPAGKARKRLPWKRLALAAAAMLLLGALVWIVPQTRVHRDQFQYSGEFPGGGAWSLFAEVHYLSEDGKPVRRFQVGEGLSGTEKIVNALEIKLDGKPVVVSAKLREALSQVDWNGNVSAYEFGKKTFFRFPFGTPGSPGQGKPEAKLHIQHAIASRIDLPGATPSDRPVICWVVPTPDEYPKPRTALMKTGTDLPNRDG